eukprot:Gb_15672 [translate_table: standard]
MHVEEASTCVEPSSNQVPPVEDQLQRKKSNVQTGDKLCHMKTIMFVKRFYGQKTMRRLFGANVLISSLQGLDAEVAKNLILEPHTGVIASITNANPTIVSCFDDERPEFQDGDLVVFTEVEGMIELNDGKLRRLKSARPYSFILEEDTTKFGVYEKGGIVAKFRHFPIPASFGNANEVVALANYINETSSNQMLDCVDEHILRHASGPHVVLNPMVTMFGGIVGQEVVKACSRKFHPLFQFFYFDSLESLPIDPLGLEDEMLLNCRYDAQISVFRRELQRKKERVKVFVIGVGTLGCEFLKNLALMGASCGSWGKLTMTKDDVIEKSNLSRQFPFWDWNIGQAKSIVETSIATKINPCFQVEALQNHASPDTENVFDDTFWESLGVVKNALDNVNARLDIDSKCDGQAQVFLEHVVECLVIERCATFEDCIAWARRKFEDYFANRVKQLTFTFPKNVATRTTSIWPTESYGIPIPDWTLNSQKLAEAADRVQVPVFQPKQKWKVICNDALASMDAFLAASIKGSRKETIVQLVSIVSLYGGIHHAPVALILACNETFGYILSMATYKPLMTSRKKDASSPTLCPPFANLKDIHASHFMNVAIVFIQGDLPKPSSRQSNAKVAQGVQDTGLKKWFGESFVKKLQCRVLDSTMGGDPVTTEPTVLVVDEEVRSILEETGS